MFTRHNKMILKLIKNFLLLGNILGSICISSVNLQNILKSGCYYYVFSR